MTVGNSPLHRAGEGVVVDFWVVPGASRTELKGIHDGAVRLRVASPPQSGQANRAVVEFLSKHLGANVEIIKGTTSRRKRVRIESADLAAIALSLGIGIR